ncbi:MAG: family 16 glycosylhydrolase [Bacteroidia bacterium]|jgi:beta-glucanase (GH16 family)|nr:family 16 glycosylhydrolase [Bacteroidia bacterium]
MTKTFFKLLICSLANLTVADVKIIAQSTGYGFPCSLCVGTPPAQQHSYCPATTYVGVAPTNPSGNYSLIFEDQFNGTDLNNNVWERDGNLMGTDHACLKEENVTIANGYCYITTKSEPGCTCNIVHSWVPPNIEYGATRNYTTGGITSKMLFGPGRFEVRCKVPWIMGVWPAFWLLGGQSHESATYQEIDVFEMIQDDPASGCSYNNGCNDPQGQGYQLPDDASKRIISTYHYFDGIGGYDNRCQYQKCYNTGVQLNNDFHIYALEWDADELRWYFDGILIAQEKRFFTQYNVAYYKQTNFPNPLAPMHIKVGTGPKHYTPMNNMQVCQTLTSVLPSDFIVDYVRVYVKCSNSATTLCYPNDPATQYITEPNEAIYGGIITFSPTCQQWPVNSGEKLMVLANSISVKNFRANPGSRVILRALPNCSYTYYASRIAQEGDTDSSSQNQFNIINSNLAILPNPSDGNFKLSFLNKTEGNLTISIFDINGRRVYSKTSTFSTGQVSMDFDSALTSGIYLLRIEETGETVRFVVN